MNRLVFMNEVENVYCAVRIEYLHKTDTFRPLRGKHKKMCFDFLYNFCLKQSSFQEEFSEMVLS